MRGIVRTPTPAVDAYRAGQNVAWQSWMERCFAATSDLAALQELLTISARSIFQYVDATLAAITALVEPERESLTRGAHAERLAVVTRPVSRASWSRLRMPWGARSAAVR